MIKTERIKELKKLIIEEQWKDRTFSLTRLMALEKELEDLKKEA